MYIQKQGRRHLKSVLLHSIEIHLNNFKCHKSPMLQRMRKRDCSQGIKPSEHGKKAEKKLLVSMNSYSMK